MWLEDRGNKGTDALIAAQNTLVQKAVAEPGGAGRALQRPRAVAAPRAHAGSRAGAVDGSRDRRRLQRHPAHARAGVRQRLLLPGPRAARADAGRRAVPHERRCAEPLLSADQRRGQQRIRAAAARPRATAWCRSPRWSVRSGWSRRRPCSASTASRAMQIVGSNAPGHSSGRGDEGDAERSSSQDLPPGFGARLGRPVAAGNPRGRRGAVALRPVDLRRVPVPGGAVRKLGHAHRGAAGRAGGHHRRHHRGLGHGPVERRVLQDRPDHHHRSGGQERHPDRGVRAARPATRHDAVRRRSWRRRACACAPS